MPQYQGIWTLAQAAQLQSTQRWATDPLFENTTLLLQADNVPNGAQNNTFADSSSNGFTITRNGNTTQGTFTPFSQSPGWWGNYFSGSSGTCLGFGFGGAGYRTLSGDFTIEAWVFWQADSGVVVGNLTASNNQALRRLSGFNFYYNNGVSVTGTTFIPLNTWAHMAVTRSGSTVRLFTNGVLDATVTDSGNFNYQYVGALAQTTNNFSGYLSNVRILSGTALYTTNFTPSTIPLTAITNTQLLTCQSNRFADNSTANSGSPWLVNVFGSPSVQAFSPFAPQYQYTPSVTGGSGYFDGTGDYLSAAANAAFQFGTGNFTIEYWYYPTSFGTNTTIDMGYANVGSYAIQNASDGKPYFYSGTTGTVFTATTGYTLNAWNHLAVTRSGTTLSMFINGARVGTATNSTNFNANFALGIGGSPTHSTVYEVIGYMSNVRLVKGTAVYDPTQTSITVPTAPLTAITNTSLLCNFTNAGIYDGTLKNNLETAGNAQVSTSVVKYGTGSMAFDGTGDYLASNAATTDLYAFGSGNFTIETWVYFNNVSNVQLIYDSRPSSTQGAYPAIYLNSDATIRYFVSSADQITSSAVVAATWYHVAVVRLNGFTRMFINGVQTGSTYTDSTVYLNGSGRPWIGLNAYNTAVQGLNGYIDDLRVTKGIARYTANFTPPSVALPRQ